MKSDRNPGNVPASGALRARAGEGWISRRKVFSLPSAIGAAVTAAIALSACIDRSNPFDPINTSPVAASDIRSANAGHLDSLAAGESVFATYLKAYGDRFAADSASDAATVQRNAATRAGNQSAAARNDSIAARNAQQTLADSLREKSPLAFLDTLAAIGPYPDLDAHLAELQIQSSRVSAFMVDVNSKHAPLSVYAAAFADSVLRPFVRDSAAFAAWEQKAASAHAAIADSNAAILAYNAARSLDNDSVGAYNELIRFRRSTQDKTLIKNPDSLQTGTATAKAGDSLNLGPGSFTVDLRFNHSGTTDSPIVVRGYPGQATVLRASSNGGTLNGSVMVISTQSNIRFEGIVFRGGGISAAKLESGSRNVVFRNCRFDSSGQWGLEVVDSDVDMQDCLVVDNGGGVRTTAAPSSDLRIRLNNILVARNRGHGLEAVSPLGDITNCTFADNSGEGIRVNSPLRALTIANTISSGNHGIGVYREPTSLNQDGFIVKECDIFGNVHADWDLTNMDSTKAGALIKANLNVDPAFINAAALNYGPKPGSALDAYAKAALPIVIGYRQK